MGNNVANETLYMEVDTYWGGNPNFRCMLMGFEMAKAQIERHFGSLVDILVNLMTEFAVKQTS